MRPFVLALLASALAAQETANPPEPGPVDPRIVKWRKLGIVAHEGDAQAALRLFVEAHRRHVAGDRDGALAKYLAFLGTPGRHELPGRYLATVRRRVDELRARLREEYDAAVTLYRKDRERGVAALEELDRRCAGLLPAGRAARDLWQSDRLRLAIDTARERAKLDRKAAAKALEKSIRDLPAGLYRYEACTLLVELGGPDLREREANEPERRREETGDEEEPDEKPSIEVNEGE